MNGYMLDTTEFNAPVDRALQPSDLAGRRLYVTHIQHDEIMQETRVERREKLLSVIKVANQINTAGAAWGISRWGKSNWTASNEVAAEMLVSLQRRDRAAKKKKRRENQQRDILIAMTAIANGVTLISGDKNLRAVTEDFGGRAIPRDQLSSEQ